MYPVLFFSQTGLKLRTALTSALMRKSLRLSARARLDYPAGKVVNLVTNDAAKIDSLMNYIHQLCT